MPAERGVPKGFVGRLPRDKEFTSLEEYADALATAVCEADAARAGACTPGSEVSGSVPRVPLETMADEQFMARFARTGTPVVLTGCLTAMGWDVAGTWSAEALARLAHGDLADMPWTVRAGASYAAMESHETTLREYLTAVAPALMRATAPRNADAPVGGAAAEEALVVAPLPPEPAPLEAPAAAPAPAARGALPYGANNPVPPALVREIVVPPLYPRHTKRLLDTRMWVGPPGAGVHMHADLQDNFLLQVFGGKRVSIVAPRHRAALGTRPVTPFLHTTRLAMGEAVPPGVLQRTVLLGPGDMLFLPAGYFHATETVRLTADQDEHAAAALAAGTGATGAAGPVTAATAGCGGGSGGAGAAMVATAAPREVACEGRAVREACACTAPESACADSDAARERDGGGKRGDEGEDKREGTSAGDVEAEAEGKAAGVRTGARSEPLAVMGLSCSINFFMSACFAALGVIVPDLSDGGDASDAAAWPVPPKGWATAARGDS